MERDSDPLLDVFAYAPKVGVKFRKLWSKNRESGALKILDHCCKEDDLLQSTKAQSKASGSNSKPGRDETCGIASPQPSVKTAGCVEGPRAGFCRILSVCAENSVSPFGVTEDEILGILEQNNVPSRFLDIIFAFGDKPGNGAAGSAQSAFQQRGGSEFDIQYNLSYVELAEGGKEDDVRYWTTRQIGVYQHYVSEDNTGFCLLLQCQKRSKAQNTIDRLKYECDGGCAKCFKILLDVHIVILSAYFQNWQTYLTVLNNCFENMAKLVITIQWDDPNDYADGQKQLQHLHLLRDRILLFSTRLQATLEVIQTLDSFESINFPRRDDSNAETIWRPWRDKLNSYKRQIDGLSHSAKSLERRMESIHTLLFAALNLRHQATGVETSGGVLKLTTEIGDDSAAVRVITFVSLLYMPATFVATLLGTNLFAYSAPGPDADFQVARKFWIYLVLALPLTMLTVGYWLFHTKRAKYLGLGKTGAPETRLLERNQKRWLNILASNGLISRRTTRGDREGECLEAP